MKKFQMKNILFVFKRLIYRTNFELLLVLLISLLTSSALFAEDFQDKKPMVTRLSLSCTQMPNHQLVVQVKMRAKPEKQYIALANAAVAIYQLTDSTEVLIGEGTTNAKGLMEIKINAKDQISINADGFYSLMATYEGDENHKSSDGDILFKPAILEMEAAIQDSINTVTIKIYEDSEDATPVEGVEVVIQVPRMFSNLPIASEYTDEEGMVSFKFPDDLPGGENGELLIIAKALDTDEHASLQGQVQNNWGIPVSTIQSKHTRALWTPDAPIWMVWTFGLLMILVWGHFMVIIYKLVLIKKEGKTLVDETR